MTTPGKTWMQLMDGWDDATSSRARVFMVEVCMAAERMEKVCLSSRSASLRWPSLPAP